MARLTRLSSILALSLGSAMALAACGSSTGSRALSGGAIGAGTGAAVGAVTDMNMSTGALIGGGIGAVAGAVTGGDDGHND